MAFTDTFNRADDGDITTSPNWTTPDAGAVSAAVVSNQLHFVAITDRVYLCPDQGVPNHYSQVVRASGVNKQYFDVVVRATDKDNWFGVRNNANVIQLFRRQAAALTQLGANVSNAPSATDVIKLEVNVLNEFRVYLNGVLIIGPIVDTFNATETRCGINTRVQAAAPALDNYTAGVVNGHRNPGLNGGVGRFGKLGA